MQSPYAEQVEAQVWEYLNDGDVHQAIATCERLNREFPNFASGWHTASQLALKLGNTPMALDAIREARRMDSENTTWALQEAQCLWRLGRAAEVRACVDHLLTCELQTAYELSGLGSLLANVGDRRKALEYYKQAAALQPDDARHRFNIASLQRTLGDLDEAESNFDKALRLNPSDFEAWKLRSELRTQTHERNHIEALEAVLETNINDAHGKANICYALAKELEDLGEADRSFAYLQRGAKARRKQMQYSLDRDLETIAAIRKTFSADFLAGDTPGHDSAEPIFVLGMPRTGTTLVERILASHTDVFAAGELSNFAVQMMQQVRAKAASRKPSRDELVQLSAGLDFAALGKAYVDSTRPATGHTARFIDKLPLNYLYVGLIHLALPNAKIIHVQRDPMDTIYAVYKTLFTDAYPFSYDLEELAAYFVAYSGLMEHWHTALPGAIQTVRYESLVAELDVEARRLVEACDLDWQPACLEFHRSEEASTTASSVQVRRPVYQSSVGKWREYESQLQPAVSVLRDAGIIE
jgi:tetratricopeptide (TPR) repeat protein